MSSHKRNVLLAILTRAGIVLALLAIAISIYVLLVRTRKEPATADPTASAPQIAVIEIRSVPVARQWRGFGTAVPARGHAANVPAQVRGVVEEVPPGIAPGATVERGDILVRLDDADYRYEVEATQHRIAEIESQIEQLQVEFRAWVERLELVQEDIKIAQHDLDRILAAQERGSATQREVDQMRTALIVAQRSEVQVREQLERIEPRQRQLEATRGQFQATLRLAQRNLDRCVITSPIGGILQHVDVEPGESVAADQRVARVVDLRRIEVPLRLPAEARASVSVGDEAIVRSAGASRAIWPAVISRIAPEDEPTTRTVTVYVEIEQQEIHGSQLTVDGTQFREPSTEYRRPDTPSIITPGKFVEGLVSSSDVRDRVVLPRRAVHADRVWMVEDGGYLRSRRINALFTMRDSFPQLGVDDTAWIVVADPLPEGALIVLDGARSLVEGSRIEPVLPNGTREAGLAARSDDARAAERESERTP